MPPIIGITCDVSEESGVVRASSALAYSNAVARAGGEPMLLPPIAALADRHAAMCDGLVLTGGGDPRMEPFGRPTHPAAKVVHARRQEYELALLRALERRPEVPVLGICLGMQWMALHAGGDLNQHLPETLASAGAHRGTHAVVGELGAGRIDSNHHQAVRDAGRLRVIARAEDGTIEGVADPSRPFYVGVQWHPERTEDDGLGLGLFRRLVAACGG
ncbi:MAG: gamma-glutamyl-gamma-aminobutyrate hydrolase family protein [Phycisphaerae bacterium]|nr:gamma-glutamyl-gamma-aminobutyrate hydrolase family protein [Phycisphaerae bacterium]